MAKQASLYSGLPLLPISIYRRPLNRPITVHTTFARSIEHIRVAEQWRITEAVATAHRWPRGKDLDGDQGLACTLQYLLYHLPKKVDMTGNIIQRKVSHIQLFSEA